MVDISRVFIVSSVFAADSPPMGGGGWPDYLVQYGVLGIVATVLILFARSAYNREVARADAAEKENKQLNELFRDRLVVSLEKSASAVEASAILIRDIRQELDWWRDEERTQRKPNRNQR